MKNYSTDCRPPSSVTMSHDFSSLGLKYEKADSKIFTYKITPSYLRKRKTCPCLLRESSHITSAPISASPLIYRLTRPPHYSARYITCVHTDNNMHFKLKHLFYANFYDKNKFILLFLLLLQDILSVHFLFHYFILHT